MHTGYIYKIVFPNGKLYVGQTIHSVKRRFYEHVYNANRKNESRTLNGAFAKYDLSEIKCEIVEEIIENTIQELKKVLNDKEIYYIKVLNSLVPNGYNLTPGGDSRVGYTHTEEFKRMISMLNKGRKPTAEALAKIVAFHTGRKRSAETCKRISDSIRGRKASAETKLKMSMTRKGKKFSDEWKRKIGASLKGRVFSEKTKQIWRDTKSHKIIKYSLDNIFITEYNNIHDASTDSGIKEAAIYKCLCGKHTSSGGYKWKYKNENK